MKLSRRLATVATGTGGSELRPHRGVGAITPGTELHLASEAVLDGFPGVAVVADAEGRVLGASEAAAKLEAAFSDDTGGPLRAAVARTLGAGSLCESITCPGGAVFDLAFLPLVGGAVLVIGRETTLEHNFQSTLVESRRRYKDFVECSTDFAWETGADGTFIFVSPRGALGYTPVDLIGRNPQDLLHQRHDEPLPTPFHSSVPRERASVWLRAADGAPAALETSCVPLFDEAGRWAGARGVCRDVTEERAKDEALDRAHRRERLVAGLVNTIREEVDPEKLLGRAAKATAQALDAGSCWIYRVRPGGDFDQVAAFGQPPGAAPPDGLAEATATIEADLGGLRVLAATARHHHVVNGAICVAREAAWSEDDAALIAAVAEHLGIAIEQIANHEELKQLSRTDALTGLLNRRAFIDEIERRHAHARRTGRPAALLYTDLDNFKLVNDVHGHQHGDAALGAWATVLTQRTRAGDMVARLGGDEFAIWLEETGEADAVAKAAELLDGSACLE
ncbi:MAG: diguanylate cyclase, partial [Proteobacteria bacterium]|nr:diguanylate cyclase [Pseudomonadota bacterium]